MRKKGEIMNKQKHTKGPWVKQTYGNYDLCGARQSWGFKISTDSEEKTSIAQIDCGNRENNFETEEANAKLIASAPELLEACKVILDGNNNGIYQLPEHYKLALTQAIAKAEGRL